MTKAPIRRVPTAAEVDHAVAQTLKVLQDERTPARVQRYYDPATDYAGRSFVALGPNEPNTITAIDLYAVSLLNVNAGAGAGRRLLHEGDRRETAIKALRAIPPDAELATADADVLSAAEAFYLAIQAALGRDPWVTTSKLCARKRPSLFPVRDRVVTLRLLGLARNRWADWLAYQSLITHDEVAVQVDQTIAEARALGGEGIVIDDPPLRVLDVALWMHAIGARL